MRFAVVALLFAGSLAAAAAPRGLEGSRDRASGGIVGAGVAPRSAVPAGTLEGDGKSATRGAAGGMRLSQATLAGTVRGFALSPDGATAVYLADATTVGRVQLFAVPVDGSAAPIELTSSLTFGTGDLGVSTFRVSPDGATVAFLADAISGSGADDLYTVPIGGGAAAAKLNATTAAPVSALGWSPDASTVAFFAGSGPIELYAATPGASGSSRRLSDVGSAQGEVVAALFDPNSVRIAYSADPAANDVYQWHTVALAAAGPGTDVQLSQALGTVNLGAFAANGATFVYTADEALPGRVEIYSTPATGGTRTKLNGAMAGDGVIALAVSASGDRVAYIADQQTAGIPEVHSARIGVAGSGVRLNTPLAGTQSADVVTVVPDGTSVVYEADENTPGTFDVLVAPIDASAAPLTLHGLVPPDSAGFFVGRGTPVVGRRAVYPVFGGAVELYSVPVDGSAGSLSVSGTPASGDSLLGAFVPDGGGRLVAYGIGPSASGVTRDLRVADARGVLATETANAPAVAGSLGVLAYGIGADETHVVWIQDQQTTGKPELYAAALDSDADGVPNAADNCAFVGNAGQGDVAFGQTVRATDGSFGWAVPADVRVARGPLDQLAGYVVDLTATVVDAVGYDDPTTPAAGAGAWYLFAVDCDARSYQTEVGAEPGRDLAALP